MLGGLWPGQGMDRFVRQHVAAEWVTSLLPHTALVLGAEAGAILPLGGSRSFITDRKAHSLLLGGGGGGDHR